MTHGEGYDRSVLGPQFCCEPKAAVKKKKSGLKKNNNKINFVLNLNIYVTSEEIAVG